MIQHIICKMLLGNEKITAYCGTNVYALSAPDGTEAPFIVVNFVEDKDNYDTVTGFEITIEIYDYDKDKRNAQNASREIKKILHKKQVDDPNGDYINIRIWFENRNHIKEPDSTLSRLFMQFSSRAIEL